MSQEVHRFLRPERVLIVDLGLNFRGCESDLSLYDAPWCETFVTNHRRMGHELEQFLDGLNVCYAPETVYDPRVYALARTYGVKIVLHLMPELFGAEGRAADVLWNPTNWRQEYLPPRTEIVPVPVALDRLPYRQRTSTRTFFHTTGEAMCDRNGTKTVMEALYHMKRPCTLLYRGGPAPQQQTWQAGPVTAHWLPPVDSYVDVIPEETDVLVAPRRYGGLCLARGSLVQGLDGIQFPIEEVQIGDVIRDETGATHVTGRTERSVDEVIAVRARGASLTSSLDHLHLVADSPTSPLRETKAIDVVPGDWILICKPTGNGIRAVHIGEKPRVKALKANHWWTDVTLDEGWARIIGLWLADGHGGLYRRPGRDRPQAVICWNFGKQKAELGLADEVVRTLARHGIHATIQYSKRATGNYGPGEAWIVRCRTLWLWHFFEALGLGKGAFGKRAPNLDVSLVPALVGGWLDGDGSETDGVVSGFSRSTEMIHDMWRLVAKAGVLASVTQRGQLLTVAARQDAATVASWTRRLPPINRSHMRRPTPVRWRPHKSGWLVKVSAVERRSETTGVIAIETDSGCYIANDILTHNCLPVQEAAARGIPSVMTQLPPQDGWMSRELLVPAPVEHPGVEMKGGKIPVYGADPLALAKVMDRLVEDDERVIAASDRARAWAESLSWSRWLPEWQAKLTTA